MNEDFRMEQGYKEAAYGDSLGRYTAKTFGWMFIGLLITFGVAIGMYMTDGLYYVSRVPGWYYILFIAEIGIVVLLHFRRYGADRIFWKYQFLCAASIYDGRTDLFSRFLAVVHVYQSVCL